MRKLLNPRWIYLVNILPLTILFILLCYEFQAVKPFLKPESFPVWYTAAGGIISIMLLHGIYACFRRKARQRVNLIFTVVSAVVCITYVFLYFEHDKHLIGWTVPSWVTSGNHLLYVTGLFMPTILYDFACSVVQLTHKPGERSITIDFLKMIMYPAAFYCVFIFLANFADIDLLFFTGIIFGLCMFLFFFFRFVYVVLTKNTRGGALKPFLLFLFGLAFPLIGLSLNLEFEVFGDFSGIGFWLLAVLNGIVLLIPSPPEKKRSLILYGLRCLTFPYIFYFMLVFLPFLPLSILLIILLGVGLLMLTPLILFVFQCDILVENYKQLKKTFSTSILLTVTLGAMLIVPLGVVLSYYHSKAVLYETLDYIYAPDYREEYKPAKRAIQKTLRATENRSGDVFYQTTPYLNSLYRKIVMGNMGLAWEKGTLLKGLFAPKNESYNKFRFQRVRERGNQAIQIRSQIHDSTYDPVRKVWFSTVHLMIENQSGRGWDTEYITYFDLPAGCWISDYYLDVNGVREPGILAEKKTATWLFDQIRGRNRDPGLLRYVGGNTIEFKVFPFMKDEVRYTGIEFMHIDPIEIQIDDYRIQLGEAPDTDEFIPVSQSYDRVLTYVSAQEKETLPYVTAEPYYHFIVDISATAGHKLRSSATTVDLRKQYETSMQTLLDMHPLASETYKVTYANVVSYTKEEKSADGAVVDWTSGLPSHIKPFQNGFFLQRAIEEILVNNYIESNEYPLKDDYPVIVVLTGNLPLAIVTDGFNDLRFTYPFINHFYCVHDYRFVEIPLFKPWTPWVKDRIVDLYDTNYKPGNHSDYYQKRATERMNREGFVPEEIELIGEYNTGTLKYFHLPKVKVRKYGERSYLPDDGQSSYAFRFPKTDSGFNPEEINVKDPQSAMAIQGRQFLHYLNPSMGKKEWLPMLQASFKSRILTPATAYMVVETQQQRRLLEEKQKQVMAGNRDLDITDDVRIMSEPELYWLVLLLLAFIAYTKRKEIRNYLINRKSI